MTDLYFEDSSERPVGTVERLRAEVDRTVAQATGAVRDARDRVVLEAKLRAHRVERRIQSQLALSALIALCSGVALGLLAAFLAGRSRGR